jgi:hypothetical protein
MVAVKGAHGEAPYDRTLPPATGVANADLPQSRLTRSARIWFVVAVVIGAVLAIVLHAVVGSIVVVASELSFGVFGRTLGPEIVASIWALLAFAASAYVFYRYHTRIRGAGVWKGLRYGSAIALLWLVGMLEGVALFGNPIHAEFLVGLSDAVPVLIMSILLGVYVLRSDSVVAGQSRRIRLAPAIATIAVVLLVGRYVGYTSGLIGSGHAEFPIQTLVWTLLMGLSAGVAFGLLWEAVDELSIMRTVVRFGFWIFGVNWFVFMIFIPMLFEGVFVDVIARVSLDILMVIIGCYLALWLWQHDQDRRMNIANETAPADGAVDGRPNLEP